MLLTSFIYFLEQNHSNVQLSVFFFYFHDGFCFESRYLTVGSRCHREPVGDRVWSTVQGKYICQFGSMVQTGSASLCASGQAPVFVVNCLNDSNKSCCSDGPCELLCET